LRVAMLLLQLCGLTLRDLLLPVELLAILHDTLPLLCDDLLLPLL